MPRTVEVRQSDINDVVADVVAIPMGCSLSPVRRVAKAVFEGSRAAQIHLASIKRSEPGGVKPASVVVFPKGTHARGGRIAIVAVHDDREGSGVDVLEPDEKRIRHSARRVLDACEQARCATLAMTPLGGVDMMAEEAVAIAADALVEHWATHPLSQLEHVVFVERTAERTQAIVDAVLARFPGAAVHVRDDDATTVIIPPPSVASLGAPIPSRPPVVVPPPEKPADMVAPYGLPTTRKHTSRLLFERWHGTCGGSPIPAGCIGVAFRFASSATTATHLVAIRVHASDIRNAWLDGKPLADGRAYLAMGEHVLAVECGPGSFACVVDAAVGTTRDRTPAKVRAVADGAVFASPVVHGDWTELAAGGASGKFEPVLASSTEPLPDWTDQRGVWLPDGTRFVRFVFPIVFEANV